MEEFKDGSPPEELLGHLKLSDQKASQSTSSLASGPKDIHNPQNMRSGYATSSAKDPTIADECFHDCHDSFEVKEPILGDEGNIQNDENSTRKQTKLDEEYLLELEKDMPEEEKQKRRKESTTLKEKGNEQFKKGDYGEAEDSYTKALQICPACFQKDRAVLFSNRAAAKMKQDKTEAALSDCSKAVELDPNYIRALLRRAELYEKTEKLDEALEDYKAVLEKDPSVHQAREACMRLPTQIEERNEKLKKEMLENPHKRARTNDSVRGSSDVMDLVMQAWEGDTSQGFQNAAALCKLKDLGNLVLRPFGLSTENFQIKQDSSTGSYSINFVQNPNNNR